MTSRVRYDRFDGCDWYDEPNDARQRLQVLEIQEDPRLKKMTGDRQFLVPVAPVAPVVRSLSVFLQALPGALVLAPMTKGSNLPYRRLCVELGARVLVSEMVVARRLKQRRRGEFALIRRAPGEPCFGVQLAGNQPDEMAWAAALVESRGADFVDLNLGCPIDHFTRKGLGAALARQPSRVGRIVEAMRRAVSVPVTVKIRLGWNATSRNYLDLAQGGRRRRRGRDYGSRPHARGAVPASGGLGCDR